MEFSTDTADVGGWENCRVKAGLNFVDWWCEGDESAYLVTVNLSKSFFILRKGHVTSALTRHAKVLYMETISLYDCIKYGTKSHTGLYSFYV